MSFTFAYGFLYRDKIQIRWRQTAMTLWPSSSVKITKGEVSHRLYFIQSFAYTHTHTHTLTDMFKMANESNSVRTGKHESNRSSHNFEWKMFFVSVRFYLWEIKRMWCITMIIIMIEVNHCLCSANCELWTKSHFILRHLSVAVCTPIFNLSPNDGYM